MSDTYLEHFHYCLLKRGWCKTAPCGLSLLLRWLQLPSLASRRHPRRYGVAGAWSAAATCFTLPTLLVFAHGGPLSFPSHFFLCVGGGRFHAWLSVDALLPLPPLRPRRPFSASDGKHMRSLDGVAAVLRGVVSSGQAAVITLIAVPEEVRGWGVAGPLRTRSITARFLVFWGSLGACVSCIWVTRPPPLPFILPRPAHRSRRALLQHSARPQRRTCRTSLRLVRGRGRRRRTLFQAPSQRRRRQRATLHGSRTTQQSPRPWRGRSA